MNVLLISKRLRGSKSLYLDKKYLFAALAVTFLLLPTAAAITGYQLAMVGVDEVVHDKYSALVQGELANQRSEIALAKQKAEDDMEALTRRLGQLQAHVIRLDALGQRLTSMADFDGSEFDFSQQPAQGGPETQLTETVPVPVDDFVQELTKLSQQLQDREQQLYVLESMIMSKNLQSEVVPNGNPVEKGWLSSYFGMRNDPFSGRRAMHKGVDFASKEGAPVIAVASGVVTWAGSRYGYGNLVEINHGSGYVTRYGHNKAILVKVGQTVEKGEHIAEVGSTGRSTGPHVHYEVIRNGRHINPSRFL